MTDKIDSDLRDKLRESIQAVLTDEDIQKSVEKGIRNMASEFEGQFEWALKDELAGNISGWAVEMAGRAVEQILNGNEDQLRRYLSCEKRAEDGEYIGWTGRSDSKYWGARRAVHEWHSVIHGQLFERGAVELRKKIVDAHRGVLVNERILDLEDQVRSLVAQVNKLEAEKERLSERIRAA